MLLKPERLQHVGDVADWRLCVGCGACAYICPTNAVHLVDFVNEGIRPRVDESKCGECRECLDVCPAVQTDFRVLRKTAPADADSGDDDFQKQWGVVLEVWEGHAADESIRFRGSSGGALTALAAYCLEVGGMHGVLHIGQDPTSPIRNRTQLSQTREELVAATGSRYSPASVCDHLDWVEHAAAPCVVVGKPSEIAAVTNARRLRPALDRKVGLTLSFFCAESPSTAATTTLLNHIGVSPDSIVDLRYRGNGWPGHFAPSQRGEPGPSAQLTYQESWAFLQAFRPWSVHLWPDGSGELADISCGDPWYQQPDGVNPGSSLIVVRTERGQSVLRGAIERGYLHVKRAEHWKLTRSQHGLLEKKGAVWGRALAMRMCNLPVGNYIGASLFECWWSLPLSQKARSVFGTLRRVIARKLYRPADFAAQADDRSGNLLSTDPKQ